MTSKKENKAKEEVEQTETEQPKTEKSKEEEYKEMLQRLQADFENYRKRVEREKTEIKYCTKAELMAKLLPVLDSFGLALKNSSDKEKFLKGIELIFAQLHGILSSEGVRQIDTVGKKFDPYMHEALMQKESEKEDIVLEELQKGYMMDNFVLRHSKIIIGEKPGSKEVEDAGIKGHAKEDSARAGED